jgi:hypothetical protein
MAEPFAGNFHKDAVRQQLRCVGVPQVMEPVPGKATLLDRLGPLLAQLAQTRGVGRGKSMP